MTGIESVIVEQRADVLLTEKEESCAAIAGDCGRDCGCGPTAKNWAGEERENAPRSTALSSPPKFNSLPGLPGV